MPTLLGKFDLHVEKGVGFEDHEIGTLGADRLQQLFELQRVVVTQFCAARQHQ